MRSRRIPPPLATSTRTSARRLRIASTDAELALWYRLRAGRLGGLKFRRQHPFPPFVVDFYCDDLALVIELDGSQHDEESDRARTSALERQGVTIMRFWDNDVLTRLDSVLEAILSAAFERRASAVPSPPAPLPQGEG
jgi:very-short-patch-repair endonuclease